MEPRKLTSVSLALSLLLSACCLSCARDCWGTERRRRDTEWAAHLPRPPQVSPPVRASNLPPPYLASWVVFRPEAQEESLPLYDAGAPPRYEAVTLSTAELIQGNSSS